MSVKYLENSLIITIPTNCAAATHRQILKGMVCSLKNSVVSETCDGDIDGLTAIAELLNVMLPTELELMKAKE